MCHTQHEPRPRVWALSSPATQPVPVAKPCPQLRGSPGPRRATYRYVIHCALSSGDSTV